jgi:predicted transcriptional regulator
MKKLSKDMTDKLIGRKGQKNAIVDKTEVISMHQKGLKNKDIAVLLNCSDAYISQLLHEVKKKSRIIKDLRENEPDILALHKAQLLNCIDYDQVKAGNTKGIKDISICYGIFDDKERRQLGLATEIYSRIDYTKEVKEVQALAEEIALLEQEDGVYAKRD